MDGVIRREEFGAIYTAFASTMTDPGNQDVVEVFYGTDIFWGGSAAGAAFIPSFQPSDIPHGEKLFALVTSNLSTYPALAHELAHLLTNTGDSPGNQTYFYPTQSAPTTSQVNTGRRMPEWVELDARTNKPLGDYAAHGNRVLTTY